MTDATRFSLAVLSGLLLFVGVAVVVVDDTAPKPVAAAESPILHVAPTTTTTEPPTTAPPETTTTAAPESDEPIERLAGGGGAVAPPRNSYAPEPIVELGRIEIPKIGLDHKVMHGITLRNIDNGPSHWPGTAMPGEVGNTVFAGHRVTHTHPFRRINELEPGDEIFFTVNGVRTRYVVTGHEIVSPARVDIVNPTPTATATLFACHPPGSAKQRYVVRAALAPLDAPAVPADVPVEGAPQA
jgi:sortase A